jgi:fumarate hydratase subunit alpha
MKIISSKNIEKAVYDLCLKANFELAPDTKEAIHNAIQAEQNERAKDILQQLVQNYEIAEKERIPLCQDTGFAVFWVTLGHQVQIHGDFLESILNRAMKNAYKDGFLRKSIVKDPVFRRENTTDNSPAIIHYDFVEGETFDIAFAPKGGGAENMSAIRMLKPSDGKQGIEDFVLETVRQAGGNPCPPIVVGIGVGGTFEKAALLAKKALFRSMNESHKDKVWAEFEQELHTKINQLNVGPQGFGGTTTALHTAIETHPCHIASLPVAINIQCHSHRHYKISF